MVVKIYDYRKYKSDNRHDKIKHNCIGTIEVDTFDANELFNICNWINRKVDKPECLHADVSFADSGICFENPETGEMWLVKSFGWFVGSKQDVKAYITKNRGKLALL